MHIFFCIIFDLCRWFQSIFAIFTPQTWRKMSLFSNLFFNFWVAKRTTRPRNKPWENVGVPRILWQTITTNPPVGHLEWWWTVREIHPKHPLTSYILLYNFSDYCKDFYKFAQEKWEKKTTRFNKNRKPRCCVTPNETRNSRRSSDTKVPTTGETVRLKVSGRFFFHICIGSMGLVYSLTYHLVDFYGECRYRRHTGILWVLFW